MPRTLNNVASQPLVSSVLRTLRVGTLVPLSPLLGPVNHGSQAAPCLAAGSAGFAIQASPLREAPPFVQSGALPAFSIEWAAGFADGEACIHVARQKYRNGRSDTFVLRVSIVQNDLQSLQRFQQGMGVHAGIYAVKRVLGQNRQCYTLNYNGPHAMQLILLLGPFLVRKRMEAITAWQFWVQGQAGQRFGPHGMPATVMATRERLYWKLRSLK